MASSDLPSTWMTSKLLLVWWPRSSKSRGRNFSSLRLGMMTEKRGFVFGIDMSRIVTDETNCWAG